MIVGCYSMDLYCGNGEKCIRREPRYGFPYRYPDQETGETASECRKYFRKRGWKFIDGDAYCPTCKGKIQ